MSFTEIAPAFLLPDAVWERIKAAIPPEAPKPKGGRPRMDNRKALNAARSITESSRYLTGATEFERVCRTTSSIAFARTKTAFGIGGSVGKTATNLLTR